MTIEWVLLFATIFNPLCTEPQQEVHKSLLLNSFQCLHASHLLVEQFYVPSEVQHL